jgi:ribose transport system substrate-binding protein
MKRTLIILVFVVMLSVTFFATEGMVDVEKYAKEGPYTVGYDIYFVGNTWSMQMYWEFKQAVIDNEDLIAEVYYTESEGNSAKQNSNIKDLIAKDVDILIVTPVSPSAIVPVLKKAIDKGIVVVLCGAKAATDDYTVYVDSDAFEFGKVGAEWLAEQLGGKGKIVALSGIAGLSTTEERWAGAKSVFDQYPEIEVVSHVFAEWAYDKAKIAAQNLIPSNPNIDGIWSGGGAMTQAFAEVMIASGLPLVPMTGEDSNGFLKLWDKYSEEGFDSIACSKPTWISAEALEAGLDVMQGIETPVDIMIPVPVIVTEDLAEYVREDLPDSYWCNSRLDEDLIKEMFQR